MNYIQYIIQPINVFFGCKNFETFHYYYFDRTIFCKNSHFYFFFKNSFELSIVVVYYY